MGIAPSGSIPDTTALSDSDKERKKMMTERYGAGAGRYEWE